MGLEHSSATDYVLERVAAAVARHPQRPAVADRLAALTYGELAERVDRFADQLRALGVGPGDAVVVTHSPGPTMVIAVLGTLVTGAAYVPVDRSQPRARVAAVVGDSGARAVVADVDAADARDACAALGVPVVAVCGAADDSGSRDGSGPSGHAAASTWRTADPDAPAYLIYTSGSTGEPKGVVVSHRQLAFSTAARRDAYPGARRFLLVSPLAFDSSVAGIWGTLTAGGTLVVAADDERRDPAVLAELVAELDVDTTLMIPSLYRLVLGAGRISGTLSGLRTVIVAGAPLDDALVRDHFATLPGAELVNEYGPTETTVWATFRRYREPGPASIGRPVPGVRAQILDERLRPTPDGAAGELVIGGPGVAVGYHGRPAATSVSFIPDPEGGPGARRYRTGDRVRRNADGDLEFLGRVDRQVKVRGQRVQLEAVEAALQAFPGVVQAAVTPDSDAAMLIAHVQLDSAAELAAVRAAAAELPAELRPDRFHQHDALPRNRNGKVDFAALDAAIAGATPAAAPAQAAPAVGDATGLVSQVGAAWAEVLKSGQVPVDANFFDLGGNSLLMMKLQAALASHTGRHASLITLFRHTTVAAQASYLEQASADGDDPERAVGRARAQRSRRSRLDVNQP